MTQHKNKNASNSYCSCCWIWAEYVIVSKYFSKNKDKILEVWSLIYSRILIIKKYKWPINRETRKSNNKYFTFLIQSMIHSYHECFIIRITRQGNCNHCRNIQNFETQTILNHACFSFLQEKCVKKPVNRLWLWARLLLVSSRICDYVLRELKKNYVHVCSVI